MDLFRVVCMMITVISQIALMAHCVYWLYRGQLNQLLTNTPKVGRPGHDVSRKILRQLNKQRATHCCFQCTAPPVKQPQRLLSCPVPFPLAVLAP